MNMIFEGNLDPLLIKLRFNISEVDLQCLKACAIQTTVHTDQFLEDFRTWLKDQPEFECYFSDEDKCTSFLAQKSEYWRVFFLGELDEHYLRSRSLEARDHFSLGLPLSFFFASINYAMDWWFTRLAAASKGEHHDQLSQAFFKRGIVDSALVTEIFVNLINNKSDEYVKATQTIIDKTKSIAHAMAKGEFSQCYQPTSERDEALALVINRLGQRLKDTVGHVNAIAKGDLSKIIEPISEKDELGLALFEMMTSLRHISESNLHDTWIKSGQTGLSHLMRGDLSLSDLADKIISYLAKYTHALIGMLYCIDRDQRTLLRPSGSYAHSLGSESGEISFGYGLVGQCAMEKEEIVLTDIPKNYVAIHSSLGSTPPSCIVVYPLIFEGEVFGVIELGYSERMNENITHLLRHVSESIAIAIKSAHDSERIKVLLQDSRRQAKELEAQKQELQIINEKLAHRQYEQHPLAS